MTSEFNSAYEKLVAAWKQREELRSSRAGTHSLLEARRHLDIARIEMMRVRGY